jgi:hypothetical protein
MGISSDGARFLAAARDAGVDFSSTMTLGRQELFLEPGDLAAAGVAPPAARAMVSGRYAEPLFRHLGADRVDAMDASDFEGATVVHDLNQPLPGELEGRYTAVLDGGTLEHVFNFPVALENAMRLTAAGGHLLLIAPANNHLGHGFYQFSPELFFRALTEENGFAVDRVLLKTSRRRAAWWEIVDPASAGGRAELLTSRATLLYVQARRVAVRPIFASQPQQSDYAAAWREAGTVGVEAPWRGRARRAIEGAGIARLARRFDPVSGFTGWPHRVPDSRYFRRVTL